MILPLGILMVGVLSCFKQYWIGLIPLGLSAILYLSFHFLTERNLVMLGDFFSVCEIGVFVYGICRLVSYLIRNRKKDKKKFEVDKSNVQDL